jgi:hypothetical protein
MFMESWKQDPYTTEHFEELIIIWHWAAGLVLYRVVPFGNERWVIGMLLKGK